MVFATLITAMGGGISAQAISGSRLDSNEIPTATPPIFGVQEFKGAILNTVLCNRKSEIQDGGR